MGIIDLANSRKGDTGVFLKIYSQ